MLTSALIAAVSAYPQILAYNAAYAPFSYTPHASFAYAGPTPQVYTDGYLTYAPSPIFYEAPAPVAYAAPAPAAYTTGVQVQRAYQPVDQHGYQIVY